MSNASITSDAPIGTSNILRFGVELEMGLQPPPEFSQQPGVVYDYRGASKFVEWLLKKWKEFKPVTQRLNLSTDYRDANDKLLEPKFANAEAKWEDRPAMPVSWLITRDPSLDEFYADKIFPVEIVSPILYYGPDAIWSKNSTLAVEDIFRFLTVHCKCIIHIRNCCSTHIHVSPIGNYNWSHQAVDTIQRIICAYYVFEPAIQRLLPPIRRGNQFARELRNEKVLRRMKTLAAGNQQQAFDLLLSNDPAGVKGVLDVLRSKQTLKQLKDRVNPEIVGYEDRRYHSWNLSNLYLDEADKTGYQTKKQSLEFRRPPGCKTASEVMHWVEFVVLFVLEACATPLSTLDQYKGTLTSLSSFLNKPLAPGKRAESILDPHANWGIDRVWQHFKDQEMVKLYNPDPPSAHPDFYRLYFEDAPQVVPAQPIAQGGGINHVLAGLGATSEDIPNSNP